MIRYWPEYMLDIETLGKTPRAAIVQIGLCGFNLMSGEVGEPFTLWVEPHPDAEIDYDTIRWWMRQSDAAREAVFRRVPTQLVAGLVRLNDHFPPAIDQYRVWAMPPEFDVTILKSAYEMCGMTPPWAYNSTRDLRTLAHISGLSKEDRVKPTIEHDAGHDAVAQALTAIQAWRRL